jgi:hypothetical protein
MLEIVSSLRDFFGQKYKESYSQSGEDMILNTTFCNIEKGFYTDDGANNLIVQSNTYFFIKKVRVALTYMLCQEAWKCSIALDHETLI